MSKIRLSVKATIFVMMAISLTGCWDNKDINHRSLPVVMGIAKKGDDYQIFLQIPEPIDNRMQVKIVEETGKTITQAVDRMSENMESQVDLLHLKIILIDKKLASQGMSEIFAFFMKVRDISPKALVVLSEDTPEEFFAKIKKKVNPVGTDVTDFFEKNAGWNPQIALTRIWQVYRSVHSYTQDVVLPIVRPGRTTTIENIGSAIIKNGRMVSQINSEETLLFNMFNGQSGQGKIEVMEHASVLINNTSLHHHSQIISGRPKLTTQMTLTVSVLEVRGHVSIEAIKKELKGLIDQRFESLLTQAKNGEADILSLGQMFRRIIPRNELGNWREEIYPKLDVDFDTRVIIQNDGFLKREG